MSKVFYDIKSAYSSHKSAEEIHELYRQVEDKDTRDDNNGKRSLLHLAASFGDAGAIDILLEGGAKSAVTNDYGDNPLHALGELSECRYNKAPDEQIYHAAKSLYEAKVSVLRKDDSGQTCYHVAAKNGNYPMIQALIDSGAKLTGTTNEGYTALHIAAKEIRHALSSLKYAKERFDNLKPIPDNLSDSWRRVEEERTESTTKDYNRDVKHVEDYFKIVKSLVEAGLDVDAKDKYGNDPLYYAVESDAKKIAAFLKGEDVNNEQALVAGGMTLFQAVKKNDAAAVKALIDMGGVDINEVNTEYRFEGKTALAMACGLVNNECVKVLLEGGADPNFKAGEHGHTAMWSLVNGAGSAINHSYTYKDELDIFNMLLKAGMDVNASVDDRSNTALILACKNYRKTELVEELINTPCDVNMANLDGQTALMMVVNSRDLKEMENVAISLLENEARTDVCDKHGKTPLMYAAENSDKNAARTFAQLMIDFGDVKADAVNNDGKTALDIATEKENEELVKLLLEVI